MSNTSERLILVVNPGGTSTRIALFESGAPLWEAEVRHPADKLAGFGSMSQQLPIRLEAVHAEMESRSLAPKSLAAVVGRGGPIVPVPSGTFAVDEAMLGAIDEGRVMVVHPSLLGAPMAHALAQPAGCPAYVVDPVSVDELLDSSKVTGLPQIERKALAHTLSIKATAREVASELGVAFEDLNLVVLHLGSGVSVAAQQKGRQIDATDASSSGPMAPTRAGDLPALDLVRICFSGNLSLKEMERLMVGGGGWVAHLGTDDVRQIYRRIDLGDDRARLVLEATQVHLAKTTAAMASHFRGELDAIAITGGIARSERFIAELRPRLAWLTDKIFIYPGEREMLALARGAERALLGQCETMSLAHYL